MAKCDTCGRITIMNGTCVDCSTHKLDNYDTLKTNFTCLEKSYQVCCKNMETLQDKLHRRNVQIKELKKYKELAEVYKEHWERTLKALEEARRKEDYRV